MLRRAVRVLSQYQRSRLSRQPSLRLQIAKNELGPVKRSPPTLDNFTCDSEMVQVVKKKFQTKIKRSQMLEALTWGKFVRMELEQKNKTDIMSHNDDQVLFETQLKRLEESTRLEDCRVYCTSLYVSMVIPMGEDPVNVYEVQDGIAAHSCYGLILYLVEKNSLGLYVKNPVTGSTWHLPSFANRYPYPKWTFYMNPCIGFDLSTRTFKVVCVIYIEKVPSFKSDKQYNRFLENQYRVLVHTLGSSDWREYSDHYYPRCLNYKFLPIYMKGYLYWFSDGYDCLLFMNLQDEQWSFSVPFPFDGKAVYAFMLWRGSIAVACYDEDKSGECYDIWVLKKDSVQEKEKWSKVFHFSNAFIVNLFGGVYKCKRKDCRNRSGCTRCVIQIVTSIRNGEVILFASGDRTQFLFYDMKKDACVEHFEAVVRGDFPRFTENFAHFNTLMEAKVTMDQLVIP